MTQPMAGWETYMDPSGQAWPYPAGFAPVPPVDPAASPAQQPVGPSVYQTPAVPVNNKFGGFGTPGSPDPTGAPVSPAGAPIQAPDIKGAADRQAAAGGPPGAPDIFGAADRGPALVPQTTTETSTTTAGVDKAGAAGIRSAGEDANKAAQADRK